MILLYLVRPYENNIARNRFTIGPLSEFCNLVNKSIKDEVGKIQKFSDDVVQINHVLTMLTPPLIQLTQKYCVEVDDENNTSNLVPAKMKPLEISAYSMLETYRADSEKSRT